MLIFFLGLLPRYCVVIILIACFVCLLASSYVKFLYFQFFFSGFWLLRGLEHRLLFVEMPQRNKLHIARNLHEFSSICTRVRDWLSWVSKLLIQLSSNFIAWIEFEWSLGIYLILLGNYIAYQVVFVLIMWHRQAWAQNFIINWGRIKLRPWMF